MSNTSKHEGGSVLADKILKPLDTLLMAYESRLNSGETLEKQWENYPNPALEKYKFAVYQRLVDGTQALIEQNKNRTKETIEQTLEPETLKDNQQETGPWDNHTQNTEIEHQKQQELDNKVVEDTEDQQDILEVKDNWPKNLWDQVQNAKHRSKTFDLAPFDELDVEKPPLHFDLTLLYGDMGSQHSQ